MLAIDGHLRVDIRLRSSEYLGGDNDILPRYIECLQYAAQLSFGLALRVYLCSIEMVDSMV
jgi:hypothetical protein